MNSKSKALKTLKQVNTEVKKRHKEYLKTGWKDEGMGSRFIPKQYRSK